MFKPGVVRSQDVCRQNTVLGQQKIFAYSLLKTSNPPQQSEIRIFETVIKEVRLASGVYRTTNRGRFFELDAVATEILVNAFPREHPLSVQDWAISDGLASTEWAGQIFKVFPTANLVASDYILYLIEAHSEKEAYIFEPGGVPLQYIKRPFVLPLAHSEPAIYVINRLLKLWVSRKVDALCGDARAFVSTAKNPDSGETQNGWTFRRISLLHPDAVAFASRNPQFEFRLHNVFSRPSSRCDVLRTMNLLNKSYFSEDQLRIGIDSALGSLNDGGVWIVGRTEERPMRNDVTIFQKQGNRTEVVGRLGLGSEIESLVLEMAIDWRSYKRGGSDAVPEECKGVFEAALI